MAMIAPIVISPCWNQVEAANQQPDADQLLRDAGEVDGDRSQPAHPLLRRGGHRGIAPPAAEHLPFGARRLERFRTGDGFDQHRMLQARIGLRVERGAAHRPLQAESGARASARSRRSARAPAIRRGPRSAPGTRRGRRCRPPARPWSTRRNRAPSHIRETRWAKAPVLPWRSAIGRFITFSNSFCD